MEFLPLIVPIFLLLLFLALFLYALIDVLTHQFKDNEKVVWVLLVVLLPFIGPILYLIIGRKKRLPKDTV